MFNKFGITEYIYLLKLFKKNGFKIKSFRDKLKKEKVVILRHDVDYCPELAYKCFFYILFFSKVRFL